MGYGIKNNFNLYLAYEEIIKPCIIENQLIPFPLYKESSYNAYRCDEISGTISIDYKFVTCLNGADIVIADLPCSGLGVLGKKPDLRYKMNEKTEADLVELQRKILSVVKDYVKPDGKLLYSTCTIHREENEGNVEWFLKEYPEFELVKDKQMIPGKDTGDGFYIAIIKRVNHE